MILRVARAAPVLALGAAAQGLAADAPLAIEPKVRTVRERALGWLKDDELQRVAERAASTAAGSEATAAAGRLSGAGPSARMQEHMAAAFRPRGFASEDYVTGDGLRATRIRSGGVTYCASALPVHTIMGERMREQGFTVKQVPCPSH
ncbi:hypothetical protein E4L96_00695 [Massilia arenosa]|uniref:Uncharacterized protein n=1 Tax=Zemynaea arenosa TaxID=2561931 RepID=A0A4Y9SZI2_9BURK|nr:hypothetical protein [Massilia arenosa]TFW30043.1 hypothetical protein E4L96_00695 [Massilia arenosa]